MTDLQPWQFCVGATLLCFVAFILWAFRNQPTGGESGFRRDIKTLEHVPNHGEMDAAIVARALHSNLNGNHGEPLTGTLVLPDDTTWPFTEYAAFVAEHGHDGDNQVTVIRHAGKR